MTAYLTSDSIIIVCDVNCPNNYQIDMGLFNDKVMITLRFQDYLALSWICCKLVYFDRKQWLSRFGSNVDKSYKRITKEY